jgi:peptidoglycan/LPS O-acetylase OafA/YrhL
MSHLTAVAADWGAESMKPIAASVVVASGAYMSVHGSPLVGYFGLALCVVGVALIMIFGILEKGERGY